MSSDLPIIDEKNQSVKEGSSRLKRGLPTPPSVAHPKKRRLFKLVSIDSYSTSLNFWEKRFHTPFWWNIKQQFMSLFWT